MNHHGRMRAEVFGLLAAVLVCSTGCGPDALYADSLGVNAEGWKSAEAAEFRWEVSDTSRVHDLYIDVRNDATYPFSNMYLFVDFTFPNGKTNRDTLALELADAQGNWLGSGSGHVHDHRIVWHDNARFPLQGQYAVRIVHAMRRDPLPGITDVGLRVEYAEPEKAGR
ncbi:MAG: gliding motility lipoprotein GldH [Flavobacteriales bacterium]